MDSKGEYELIMARMRTKRAAVATGRGQDKTRVLVGKAQSPS